VNALDERGYRENIQKLVFSLLDKEVNNFISQKGLHKYLNGNLDKIINKNLNSLMGNERVYLRVLKRSSEQLRINSVAKIIKNEKILREKKELIEFARYLKINISNKSSYTQVLKKVTKYIYQNRQNYSNKYVFYKRGEQEYILKPHLIKDEILKDYKQKTKNDILSVAKTLNVEVDENLKTEEIRKEIIKSIVKEKIKRK